MKVILIIQTFLPKVFRQAKSFFDNPNIEIHGGVSLLKSNEGRRGRSLQDNTIAIETAPTFEARNGEIGTYLMESAKNFFEERSLNFNNDAGSFRDSIVKGRDLRKAALKLLFKVLFVIGAKIGLLVLGAFVGLIVKKALLVSVLTLGLASISAVANGAGLLGSFGGVFGGKNSDSNPGWSSGYSNDGWSSSGSVWDSSGAYSSPLAQLDVYSGHPQDVYR